MHWVERPWPARSVFALAAQADATVVADARPLEEIQRKDCASLDATAMSAAVPAPV
jgi:hypothetical protein